MDLIVEGVSHAYGTVTALSEISLTVRDGETWVLIGPSGCGKSTLLGIMGGILAPSSGRVLTRGQAPEGCLNPLTYVFQDFALLPWRTVEGNVGLALEHHHLGSLERRRRVEEVLTLTGLADFAHAFPKQLSGGMRQRVGIARAIAVRPAVLLLDEPLSALDAQTRELLMEEMVAIWTRERTTSVYVTHNLNEAIRLADKVLVLSRRPGRLKRIVEIGVPRPLRTEPEHARELARLHDELWSLIREEARLADREIQNG